MSTSPSQRKPGHSTASPPSSPPTRSVRGWPGCGEHHRHLGNGWCTRPPQLDCAFESICETCSYFQTSIEFRPGLQAQHDDALAKNQASRAAPFSSLITRTGQDQAS
jgi:hypothetical protein